MHCTWFTMPMVSRAFADSYPGHRTGLVIIPMLMVIGPIMSPFQPNYSIKVMTRYNKIFVRNTPHFNQVEKKRKVGCSLAVILSHSKGPF